MDLFKDCYLMFPNPDQLTFLCPQDMRFKFVACINFPSAFDYSFASIVVLSRALECVFGLTNF